jgi:hypothetical protein
MGELKTAVAGLTKTETECSATQTERWRQHEELHAGMKGKQWGGDIAAAILGLIGIVRAFFGP